MLGTVEHPKGGDPAQYKWAAGIAAEYMDVVTKGILDHPRSQQKLIGPSEIGIPCDRALIHKLAQDTEPERGPAWKPAVGTAVHAQLEEWFGKDPDQWLVEQRVMVGKIGGTEIHGSTDLFNKAGAVIDHKAVGPGRLRIYKSKGPSQQYRVQAHCYGRGWDLDGWPVHIVMIAFIPRDGELRDSYFWWEPYNEVIALQALARAEHRFGLIKMFGKDQALKLFPFCGDMWCDWCKADGRGAEDPGANPGKLLNPFQVQNKQ